MFKQLLQLIGFSKRDEMVAKRFQQIRRLHDKPSDAYAIGPITQIRTTFESEVVGSTTGEWELAWRRTMLDRCAERSSAATEAAASIAPTVPPVPSNAG